jgi:hypothetical protein
MRQARDFGSLLHLGDKELGSETASEFLVVAKCAVWLRIQMVILAVAKCCLVVAFRSGYPRASEKHLLLLGN